MRSSDIKPIRRRVLAAVVFAAATAMAACGSSRPPQSGPIAQAPTATPGAPAPARVDLDGQVKVALLVPSTHADGRARMEAEGLADAARLAARDLGDPRFELAVYDTRGDATGAAEAARKAVADGAALILGPVFAADAEAAAPVAEQAGLSVISFSTTESIAGGNVWLIGMLAQAEADRIIGYAASRGEGAIGVFYPDTPYGATARDAVMRAASRAGASVAATGSYNRSFEGIQAGGKTYADQHNASGAVAVVLPEEGQGLRTAAAFLDYYGVSPRENRFLGLGTWNDPIATKEPALRGGWFPAPEPGKMNEFAQRFQAAYGRAPSRLSPLGYDAVAAAGTLLREARARDDDTPFGADDITDPQGFIGVTGVFRFTRDGLNERGLAVLEVGQDGFTVIDPAPAVFGTPGA
jgi:branched-chain amino acid transport system substrate-binding protein